MFCGPTFVFKILKTKVGAKPLSHPAPLRHFKKSFNRRAGVVQFILASGKNLRRHIFHARQIKHVPDGAPCDEAFGAVGKYEYLRRRIFCRHFVRY